MRIYSPAAPEHAHGLRRHEYPIVQLVRSRSTRFQVGFARMTMYLLPYANDVALEPCEEGLRIHAASDTALAFARDLIRQIHGDDVEFGESKVRPLDGAQVQA